MLSFIFLVSCATYIHAKDQSKGNIDKFYKTNIERQAEESDSEQIKTVIKLDDEEQKITYLSRGFGNRKINPKGVVLDDAAVRAESRRQEDIEDPDNEPNVHESEPEEPAIALTDIINKPDEYTTEAPTSSRPSHESRWSHTGQQSYPVSYSSHSPRSSGRSGHGSGRSMQKSEVQQSHSSSSSSSSSNDEEAQPSIPQPTKPESSIKVKDGQAAARQYFYNSRWVPKTYDHQPQQSHKQHQYGTGYGQETQQFGKMAERGNEMLLVFAHSSKL